MGRIDGLWELLSEDWLFQLHQEIAFLLFHFVNVLCHGSLCLVAGVSCPWMHKPSSLDHSQWGPGKWQVLAGFLPLPRTSTRRQEFLPSRSFV